MKLNYCLYKLDTGTCLQNCSAIHYDQ